MGLPQALTCIQKTGVQWLIGKLNSKLMINDINEYHFNATKFVTIMRQWVVLQWLHETM